MASIRERKDSDGQSKWHVQIRLLGHPPQTKTFARKGDARAWADETERQMKTGGFSISNKAQTKTVADLFQEFRANYMRSTRKKDYTQILKWWERRLGTYFLSEVRAALIQKHLDEFGQSEVVEGRKRAPATLVRYLAVLSKVMSVAVNNLEWLDRSPISGVRRPETAIQRIPTVLKISDEHLLLQSASKSTQPLLDVVIRIALRTGMRLSEILNLKWEDIEWHDDHAMLNLRKTKNNTQRYAPLVWDAFDATKLLYLSYEPRPSGAALVFPSLNNPDRPLTIRLAWEKCVADAGLRLRFHDLRHSAASRCASSGVSQAEIGELLGHADQRSTQIYTHFAKDHLVDMAKRVAAMAGPRLIKDSAEPLRLSLVSNPS